MSKPEAELIQPLDELDNFSEAADALSELSELDVQMAEKYAMDFLRNKKGDVQLQASSLEVLYAVKKSAAYQFIIENGSSVDPYIFKSMLGLVAEDCSLIDDSPELTGVVRFLSSELSKFDNNGLSRIGDTADWFKDTYSNLIET